MALSLAVPLFGPPASGKTTLTLALAKEPGRHIFRLREHVPRDALAATVTSADRLGWIDDNTVSAAVRSYLKWIADEDGIHTVLLDNFPGSGEQVSLLLKTVRDVEPNCRLTAVELTADTRVLDERAQNRRVCHRCERDPISDPRLPAVAHTDDPWKCSQCGNLLHPRRGDSPSLFHARMQRYQRTSETIRTAFTDAGVAVSQLDGAKTTEQLAQLLSPLLIARSIDS